MLKKTLLGIVGLPGSGKSTALTIIKKIAPIITMGDIVRSEVLKTGAEINPQTLGEMSKNMRINGGETIIAEKCVELIKHMNEELIFIDGIRSMHEVNYFRMHWDFYIIAILCSDQIRHKRLLERGRKDDSISMEDILIRDRREIEYGVSEVIKAASYKILNENGIPNLKQEIMKITSIFLNKTV